MGRTQGRGEERWNRGQIRRWGEPGMSKVGWEAGEEGEEVAGARQATLWGRIRAIPLPQPGQHPAPCKVPKGNLVMGSECTPVAALRPLHPTLNGASGNPHPDNPPRPDTPEPLYGPQTTRNSHKVLWGGVGWGCTPRGPCACVTSLYACVWV